MIMELNGSTRDSSVAIRICNGQKAYMSKVVLRNLNMTIPAGIIYGLLGPSGCGKTTVINCIVGQLELDSGSIEIDATKRSDIGYMPQSTSLHDSLTVYENISFFGFLVGMSENSIRTRTDELIALLDIPSTDRLVVTLSGGQKRRVAVAIALLHNPKILIMDEPTVGLDPIMRQCIWDHLLKLAAAGKSILITTHYIEETRQAHMVGILREGVLLAEESPDSLMAEYHCENLENVFLKLTQNYEKMKTNSELVKNLDRKQVLKKTYQDDHEIFSLKRFRALVYKNLMQLKGSPTFLSFLMILPFFHMLFFNLAIGNKPKNLQIIVVNEESSCADRSSYHHSCFSDENSTSFLSCLYLDLLRDQSYNLVNYDDLQSGKKEVTDKNGNTWALLHFDKNFSKTLGRRLDEEDFSENEISDSFLEVWIDHSDQYIGTFIKHDILTVMLPFLKEALLNCNMNPKLVHGLMGIDLQTPIYGSVDTQFSAYAAPAAICLSSMFYPSLATALYVQDERMSGIINRMTVSGATITEILSSIALIIFGIHIIQTTANFLIMFVLFSNVLHGSLIAYSVLQLLIGSSGIIYGFILALMTDEILFIGMATAGFNLILSITTGLAWPTEAAHRIIQIMNRYCLPLGDAVIAARDITFKNNSISNPIILRGYISIIVWNFVFLFVLMSIIKLRKNVLLAKAAIR